MYITYSFQDVSLVASHPSIGQFVANGQGLGNINVTMSQDRTTHDTAADGTIMVSKIRARNGLIAITTQQTSSLDKWLLKWYNYIEAAATDEWASMTITLRAPTMGDLITLTGVSPQKLRDKPYQGQGQNVTWNLMAADVQQDTV